MLLYWKLEQVNFRVKDLLPPYWFQVGLDVIKYAVVTALVNTDPVISNMKTNFPAITHELNMLQFCFSIKSMAWAGVIVCKLTYYRENAVAHIKLRTNQ